jgi:hypothetical protein
MGCGAQKVQMHHDTKGDYPVTKGDPFPVEMQQQKPLHTVVDDPVEVQEPVTVEGEVAVSGVRNAVLVANTPHRPLFTQEIPPPPPEHEVMYTARDDYAWQHDAILKPPLDIPEGSYQLELAGGTLLEAIDGEVDPVVLNLENDDTGMVYQVELEKWWGMTDPRTGEARILKYLREPGYRFVIFDGDGFVIKGQDQNGLVLRVRNPNAWGFRKVKPILMPDVPNVPIESPHLATLHAVTVAKDTAAHNTEVLHNVAREGRAMVIARDQEQLANAGALPYLDTAIPTDIGSEAQRYMKMYGTGGGGTPALKPGAPPPATTAATDPARYTEPVVCDTLPNAKQYMKYAGKLKIEGPSTYTVVATRGLENTGLAADTTGKVFGTPQVSGELLITVTVQNEWGVPSHHVVRLFIENAPPPKPQPAKPKPAQPPTPAGP